MQEHDIPSLIKVVPGHLLQFEEKIFGMSLTQLLSDLGAAFGIVAVTTSVPLVPRIVVGMFTMIVILILVHGKVGGYTMLSWLFLIGRSRFLPTQTVWRSQGTQIPKGESGSVQDCWIQLHELDHGVADVITPRKHWDEPEATYWVIFEVKSLQQVRFLAEAEQVRIYGRFKQFLDGLGFPLKFISLVETADPERDPAYVAQHQMHWQLAATPQLQRLQRESLQYQQGSLPYCTTTRHLMVVSASSSELARRRSDEASRSPLRRLFELVVPKKAPEITREHVKNELRIRVSIIKKALQHLDVHATLLDDVAALQATASCLALGTHLPSFEVEVLDQGVALSEAPPHDEREAAGHNRAAVKGSISVPKQASSSQANEPRWKKRIIGLHRSFVYDSANSQARFEQGAIRVEDLIAPSAVTLLKDAIIVTVRDTKRYQRYYDVKSQLFRTPELTHVRSYS